MNSIKNALIPTEGLFISNENNKSYSYFSGTEMKEFLYCVKLFCNFSNHFFTKTPGINNK